MNSEGGEVNEAMRRVLREYPEADRIVEGRRAGHVVAWLRGGLTGSTLGHSWEDAAQWFPRAVPDSTSDTREESE